MSIGERITELRKKSGLSQGELASIMNVSRQAVSKWENDTSSPDTIRLIQLADVLNTEVEYLATGRMPVYEKPPEEIVFQKKRGTSQGGHRRKSHRTPGHQNKNQTGSQNQIQNGANYCRFDWSMLFFGWSVGWASAVIQSSCPSRLRSFICHKLYIPSKK